MEDKILRFIEKYMPSLYRRGSFLYLKPKLNFIFMDAFSIFLAIFALEMYLAFLVFFISSPKEVRFNYASNEVFQISSGGVTKPIIYDVNFVEKDIIRDVYRMAKKYPGINVTYVVTK